VVYFFHDSSLDILFKVNTIFLVGNMFGLTPALCKGEGVWKDYLVLLPPPSPLQRAGVRPFKLIL